MEEVELDLRLLGRFTKPVAAQYQEILENTGITVRVVDTSNPGLRGGLIMVQLLVPKDDYEKSVMIITAFEKRNTSSVAEETIELDHKVYLVMGAIIAAFLMYVINTN